jgi:gluconolactonase
VRLLPDGTATKVGVFVRLSGGLAGPDGLALNEEEGLAIAHAGYGVVWICSRLGDPMIAVRSTEGIYTTNVAYGGVDRRDLYITESYSATILRARVDVPGRPMYSHM